MRCLFTAIVWGEPYIKKFLKVSLPSQMGEGNLTPGFHFLKGSRYQFLTTREDARRLKEAPLVKKLATFIEVEFVFIDAVPRDNKYLGASLVQVEALKRSVDYDCIFFIYPDFICANYTITHLAEKIFEGYDGVFAPVPCILEEPMVDGTVLDGNRFPLPDGGSVISIPPQELVRLSVTFPHRMMLAYFLEATSKNTVQAYLQWNVPEQGWLIHAFHLHPCVLRVQHENPIFMQLFDISLDEEFVAALFKSTDNVYVARDSQEVALVSLREALAPLHPVAGQQTMRDIVRYAEESASLVHREFVKMPFRWHFAPVVENEWQQIENQAKSLISEIIVNLNTPDEVLKFEDPLMYYIRLHRRQRFFHRWQEGRPPHSIYDMTPCPSERFDELGSAAPVPIAQQSVSARQVFWQVIRIFSRMFGLRYFLRIPMFLRLWIRVRVWVAPRT